MKKQRKSIPAATKAAVMKEFRQLCAICGKASPQIHHIDEDPGNNDPDNLLPLCPNCHLLDQHNPTAQIDPRKLKLFRRYKDPLILSPQFEPLFRRMRFILDALDRRFDYDQDSGMAYELVDFVSNLEMGAFYSGKLKKLICDFGAAVSMLDGDPEHHAQWLAIEEASYEECLDRGAAEAVDLLVELLRYQRWEVPQHTRR